MAVATWFVKRFGQTRLPFKLKEFCRYCTEVKLNATPEDITQLEGSVNKPQCTRLVPKTKEEVELLRQQPIKQPENPHRLQVAMVGLPNSGKSTLTNGLMGWRIASVSQKAHTTRQNTKGIFVEGNTQIIFVDTPGLVSMGEKKRFGLNEAMVVDPEESIKKSDLVIALVDSANKWTRTLIDRKMLRLLHLQKNRNAVLVLNKVDSLKSKQLLLNLTHSLTGGRIDGESFIATKKVKSGDDIIRQTKRRLNIKFSTDEEEDVDAVLDAMKGHWPYFKRVFMISAKNDDGIRELKKFLLESAKPDPWLYPGSFVTDQPPADIALMAVKEKLLDHLPQEIPYQTKLKIEMWEVDPIGILRIVVEIACPRKGMMTIVIGPTGQTIAQVSEEARQELTNTFRCEVSLKLIVTLDK